MEGRTSDIPGLVLPTWAEVGARGYEAWREGERVDAAWETGMRRWGEGWHDSGQWSRSRWTGVQPEDEWVAIAEVQFRRCGRRRQSRPGLAGGARGRLSASTAFPRTWGKGRDCNRLSVIAFGATLERGPCELGCKLR